MTTKKTTTKKKGSPSAKKKIKISEDSGRKLQLSKEEVENLAGGAPSSVGTKLHCNPY